MCSFVWTDCACVCVNIMVFVFGLQYAFELIHMDSGLLVLVYACVRVYVRAPVRAA